MKVYPPGSLYPLMYVRDLPEGTPGRVVVKISLYDLTSYNSSWMDDEDLGSWVSVPDTDLCIQEHLFGTELEALRFIQTWWAEQDLG